MPQPAACLWQFPPTATGFSRYYPQDLVLPFANHPFPSPEKHSAGSSSHEWREDQGAGDLFLSFLSQRGKARQELRQLLPAEATHTQGRAVTLL